MAAMFAWMHIPGLDAYMPERYGEAFTGYASRTWKLVPFM